VARQLSSGAPFTVEEFNNIVNEINDLAVQVNSIQKIQSNTRLTHNINGVDVDLGKIKFVTGKHTIAWLGNASQQIQLTFGSIFQGASSNLPTLTVTPQITNSTKTLEVSISDISNSGAVLSLYAPSTIKANTTIILNYVAIGTR
jgi:hypothetical protein